MKKCSGRLRLLFGGTVLVAMLCLLTCGGCGLLGNMLQEAPPEREFEIEELLIDASAFPPGWETDSEGPHIPAGQAPLGGGPMSLQRRVLFFHVCGGGGGAFEQIYRMTSVRGAAKEFERQMTVWFPTRGYWTPWEHPIEVLYERSVADRFHMACARDLARPDLAQKCHFIGQYEEYLVWFSTDMSPTFMTYEDLERILQAIDEQMTQHLGKEVE